MATGDSIRSGAGHPQCTNELDIAVQVTGLQHTGEKQHQSLKLQHFNQDDKATSKLLDPQKNKEINKATVAPSTIFEWDKKAKTPEGEKTKLILEIEAEQGKIQLPLTDYFTSDGSTPKIDNYYLTNRVYAITPIINIGSLKGTTYYKPPAYAGQRDGHPNLEGYPPIPPEPVYTVCRTGYLYIFLNGKLWRELFISRDDEGNNTYQDVDLAAYLEKQPDGTERYKNGQRTPTGKPLLDIWVPGAFYSSRGEKLNNIRLAYSDMQLSTERIYYLEKNPAKRNIRTSQFQWLTSETDQYKANKPFVRKISPQPNKAFPIFKHKGNKATNITSRARDELTELSLDAPYDYLKKEDHLNKANILTTGFYNRTKDGLPIYSYETEIDISAIHYLLLKDKEQLSEAEQKSKQYLSEVWDATTPFKNIMEPLAERGIWGIIVEDSNYLLVHHKARIQSALNVYPLLAEQAEALKFHTLASFIEKQRTHIKAFDDGVKDGIGDAITSGMNTTYDKAVAFRRRLMIAPKIKAWQKRLTETLAQPVTKEVLADMLSNYDNETDLAGHYNHCVENLFFACIAEDKYDPFAPPKVDYKYEAYQESPEKFIFDVYTQIDNQLHKMLWPEASIEDIEQPQQPIPEQPNNGDGLFNPSIWEKIAKNDSLKGGTPTTFNGVTLMGVQHYAEYLPLKMGDGLVFLKNTTTLLYNMLDKLQYIVDRTTHVALNSRRDWIKAIRDLNDAQQDYHTKQKELTKAAIKEEKAQKALEKYHKKVEACNQKLQQIADDFDYQLEKAMVAKAKVSVKNISLLRTFSAGKFYNLQFSAVTDLPLDGKVTLYGKSYRILGMVDRRQVNKATTKKMGSKFQLLFENTPITNNGKQSVYLAIMPSDDPYVKIRDKHITEEIPKAQKHIAKTNKAITAVNNQLVGLSQARQLAQTNEQAAAGVLHDAAHSEHTKFTLFRGKAIAADSMDRIQTVAQKIYKTGMVPPFLLYLEVLNFTRISDSFEKVENDRGSPRAWAGLIVAGGDMIMAGVVVAEQLQAQGYLFARQAPLTKALDAPSKLLLKMGLKGPTRLVPFGVLAIANIGLSGWDAITAHRRGDTGSFIGNLVLAGAGAAMLLGLYAGKSSIVLTLGPVGWFLWAVGLTIAGFLILLLFADNELEQWFKQGPFGKYERHPLIQSESAAFAALLNIMTRPEIVVTNNPYQALAKQKQHAMKLEGHSEQSADYQFIKKIANANTCISVTSGFLNFLQNDVNILCEAKAYRRDTTIIVEDVDRSYGSSGISTVYSVTDAAFVIHEEPTANGWMLFAYTPKDNFNSNRVSASLNIPRYGTDFNYGQSTTSQTPKTKIENKNYLWVIAVQVQTTLSDIAGDQSVFYFPAPHFTEAKPYNEKLHGEPTFITKQNTNDVSYLSIRDTIQQDYWLKESFLTGSITYDA